MKIEKPFCVRTIPTPETIALLESVTLGSNGARYRHLDTRERVTQLYDPVFLNLDRNERTLANITFCRREVGWYLRYFAFDTSFQTAKKKSKIKTGGVLKKQLNDFFEEMLNDDQDNTPDLLYAFIDPKNTRSLLMSKNFGFTTKAKIATQTFSRIKPRKQKGVKQIPIDQLEDVYSKVDEFYGEHQLYFNKHTFNKDPFYGYYNEEGEVLAFVKVYKAKWSIEQLPGRGGKILTNIIPFIPRLRNIIKPKRHVFSAVEALWVSEHSNQTEVVEALFEGVIHGEETNSLIWWVDATGEPYQSLTKTLNWGLLHKLNGVNSVDLVVRERNKGRQLKKGPFYITAFDFI